MCILHFDVAVGHCILCADWLLGCCCGIITVDDAALTVVAGVAAEFHQLFHKIVFKSVYKKIAKFHLLDVLVTPRTRVVYDIRAFSRLNLSKTVTFNLKRFH